MVVGIIAAVSYTHLDVYKRQKVDVVIYAVEKSSDSYKFNLLHCKQTFISQLKRGAMGARTIDEGAMDEKDVYKRQLLDYLRTNRFEQASDDAFIRERADRAAERYELSLIHI